MLLLLLLLPDEGTGEGQARGEPLLFLEGRGQRHFLRDKHQASAPLEGRDRCAIDSQASRDSRFPNTQLE